MDEVSQLYRVLIRARNASYFHQRAKIIMSNYLLQILMNFFSRSIELAPLGVVTKGILVSVGRDIARDTRVSIDMPDTTDI